MRVFVFWGNKSNVTNSCYLFRHVLLFTRDTVLFVLNQAAAMQEFCLWALMGVNL